MNMSMAPSSMQTQQMRAHANGHGTQARAHDVAAPPFDPAVSLEDTLHSLLAMAYD